jgi:hypothetical protein
MVLSNRLGVLPTSRQLILKQQLQFAGAEAAAFSPADLDDLELWYDFSDPSTLFTDAGLTPVSSDGDKVYQVNDKSGNGLNAVQTDSDERSLYKVNIQNSLSALSNNGNYSGYGLSNLSIAADLYILAVLQLGSVSWEPLVRGSGGDDGSTIQFQSTTAIRFRSGGSNSKSIYSGSFSTGAFYLWEIRRLSDDLKIWQNGVDVTDGAQTDDGTAFDISDFIFNFPGYLGELLVYSQAVSGGDQSNLRAYAKDKWGVYE